MSENKIEEATAQTGGVSQEEFEALKLQLQEQNKKLEALLKADVPAPITEEVPEIPKESFKVGEKEYKFTHAQFVIPGIGKRTAMEALADKETLKTIVENNLGVVKQVF